MPATSVPSLWSQDASRRVRPSLSGDITTDVVIVGAGYSGLWLAHWLGSLDPDLDVVVVERERIGFGASGRNGGWVSALLPVSLTTLAKAIGDEPTVRLQAEMFEAVREIGRVSESETLGCHYRLGGSLALMRNAAQLKRAETELTDYARFGFGAHARRLDSAATRQRIFFDGESVFRPDCAVIHPMRLVNGLADLVERRGARIYEHSPVTRIGNREIDTDRGRVQARYVIDCREAYGAPDSRRRIVPIYSLMLATEPLGSDVWRTIGLSSHEAFTDHRHQLVYGQRTADDRLAFGGRGVGYHFGSRVHPSFDLHPDVHRDLHRSLLELFPILGDARITHRWGGPLAVPRDWTWTVSLDATTGRGVTGGYTGDGVTSSYVAARAMAHAIVHAHTDFPLFGHRSPRWEREPIRWIGINAMTRLAGMLDTRESRGRSTRILGRLFEKLVG